MMVMPRFKVRIARKYFVPLLLKGLWFNGRETSHNHFENLYKKREKDLTTSCSGATRLLLVRSVCTWLNFQV